MSPALPTSFPYCFLHLVSVPSIRQAELSSFLWNSEPANLSWGREEGGEGERETLEGPPHHQAQLLIFTDGEFVWSLGGKWQILNSQLLKGGIY